LSTQLKQNNVEISSQISGCWSVGNLYGGVGKSIGSPLLNGLFLRWAAEFCPPADSRLTGGMREQIKGEYD
jgi:hypothetical protein